MRETSKLKALLEDGTMFFNHFVRCSGSVTHKTIRRAYYRGAAILPPIGYKGVDIILPIHCGGQTKDPYIIVQVKNRQNDAFGECPET